MEITYSQQLRIAPENRCYQSKAGHIGRSKIALAISETAIAKAIALLTKCSLENEGSHFLGRLFGNRSICYHYIHNKIKFLLNLHNESCRIVITELATVV